MLRGQTTIETVYGITSLSPEQADATKVLRLLRDHGPIENGLHYVRDVTFGEDGCRVRTGQAPPVLAALRNAAVHLIAQLDAESVPAAIERLAARPDEALELIGLPPIE
jgi:hypothetical protein